MNINYNIAFIKSGMIKKKGGRKHGNKERRSANSCDFSIDAHAHDFPAELYLQMITSQISFQK